MSNYDAAASPAVVADPKKPLKAVAALVLTFAGTLWATLAGRDNLENMTPMEWAAIILSTLVTTGAVYGIPNPIVRKGNTSRG